MEDDIDKSVLNEIRTIIGSNVYNELEKGRKQKIENNRKNNGGRTNEKQHDPGVKEITSINNESNRIIRKRKWNKGKEKNSKQRKDAEEKNERNEEIVKTKKNNHWSLIQRNEVCKFFFLRGKCKNGDHCLFSHDITPLYKLSKLCKFQLRGDCTRPECPFSHNINMFYCRNDLIGGNCSNPSCQFKHSHIDTKSKDQKAINSEVDRVLSSNDKIRFVYNNKNFIMDILIRKYFNFTTLSNLNFNEINKNENFPWYINSAIDLFKIDLQQNKAQYFFHLLENYTQEKKRNLLKYVDDENLKLQEQKTEQEKILPLIKSTSSAIVKEYTKQTPSNYNSENKKNLEKSNLNETDNPFDECSLFSSDEDEDYSKYLNTYLEIET